MTAREAVARVDSLHPNTFSEEEKLRWVETVENAIKLEIISTHEPGDPPGDGELSAPSPYDDLYVLWLDACIDARNGEFDAYANSRVMFNSAYSAFADYINRTRAPKRASPKFE
ncbi:MAG: hypothetical protein IJS78_06450 [Clostridia bacterium]|nr:hypothetical protein [Clostridia bacterium]